MDLTLVLGLMLLIAILVAVAVSSTRRRGVLDDVQVAPKRLMTDRERRVAEMIEAAVPDCRVHAQVAMAAILTHKKQADRRGRTSVRNRFDRKMVDYVVEHRASGDILCIVELDDRTHNAAKDAARDKLTTAAGYTTVRLPAGERVTPSWSEKASLC